MQANRKMRDKINYNVNDENKRIKQIKITEQFLSQYRGNLELRDTDSYRF